MHGQRVSSLHVPLWEIVLLVGNALVQWSDFNMQELEFACPRVHFVRLCSAKITDREARFAPTRVVPVFVNSKEASFIDWIIGLLSAKRTPLLIKDRQFAHVDPPDHVLRDRDVFTSIFLAQMFHDFLVDVSRMISIAGHLHTIDLCDWIPALDIRLSDHLNHLLLPIRVLELVLNWAWNLSQLTGLIRDLAVLKGHSVVITSAMRALSDREKSTDYVRWLILSGEVLPPALFLEKLHLAQLPRLPLGHLLLLVLEVASTSVVVAIAMRVARASVVAPSSFIPGTARSPIGSPGIFPRFRLIVHLELFCLLN